MDSNKPTLGHLISMLKEDKLEGDKFIFYTEKGDFSGYTTLESLKDLAELDKKTDEELCMKIWKQGDEK